MDLVIRDSDDIEHTPSLTTARFCFLRIPLSMYISNTSKINMYNYNSHEHVVFRMIALISTYFIIYFGNIIFRRVAIIAKSEY